MRDEDVGSCVSSKKWRRGWLEEAEDKSLRVTERETRRKSERMRACDGRMGDLRIYLPFHDCGGVYALSVEGPMAVYVQILRGG